MKPNLARLVIYTKNIEKMSAFYEKYFGFKVRTLPWDRIVELVPSNGGATILLHQAARSVKIGQVTVKLSFDVDDVEKFHAQCAKKGLKFGSIHKGDGYFFANAKDPDKNSIQISNRKIK